MEPVAAANYYETTLDHDELILIGDFGGGTSDFSLVNAGPGVRKSKDHIVGNAGVGLAGDAFDAKIVRHLVSPALGAGTEIRSLEKTLPVPGWVYAKLERWHHLSFLKATRHHEHAGAACRLTRIHPDRIAALIHLIQEDLGYQLHRAVQKLKTDLSAHTNARFRFTDYTVDLDETVQRADFEKWIAEELALIENCVDDLLRAHGIHASDIDKVFLTGGTSFVPAVRRIFEARFGAARIEAGNEFTSIARGLALSNTGQRRTSKSARQPRSTQIPRLS